MLGASHRGIHFCGGRPGLDEHCHRSLLRRNQQHVDLAVRLWRCRIMILHCSSAHLLYEHNYFRPHFLQMYDIDPAIGGWNSTLPALPHKLKEQDSG
jgi:hypothetical protein